ELTDRAGCRGRGFGYTIGSGGTAILSLLQDSLLPAVLDQDSRAIVALMRRLTKGIHALTPGCISSTALAAIDVALWDLAGVRTGAPLYQLLGGALDRVRLYNTHPDGTGVEAVDQTGRAFGLPFDEPGHGIRFDDEALDRFAVARAGSGMLQESR